MRCSRCGVELQEGAQWCPYCGAGAPGQAGWPQPPAGYDPRQSAGGFQYPPQYSQYYYYPQQPPYPGMQWPQSYQGYGYPQPWGMDRGPVSATRGTALVLSIIAIACGALVVLSTFLPWVGIMGQHASGWNALSNAGGVSNGNFLFSYGEGMLIFSGFWPLFLGIVIFAGVSVLFFGRRFGVRVAQAAAGLGAILSLVNIVMLYTHHLSAGVGLWLFLAMSLAAGVFAQLALRSSVSY